MAIVRSLTSGTIFLPVTESSQVGEARRRVIELAIELDFDEVSKGEAAIVVTELATNLIKHATAGGALSISRTFGDDAEIEIICLDKGPGIANFDQAVSDGFSTAGSLGHGLGSVKRLARTFDWYSIPGKGTTIACRLAPRRHVEKRSWPSMAAISIAKRGEPVCGDSWGVTCEPNYVVASVADGLGHGLEACEASSAAIKHVFLDVIQSPAAIMTSVHRKLHGTRGAALAIARVDLVDDSLTFCGLGNIAATLCGENGRQQLLSHDGTAGFQAQRIREHQYKTTDYSLLVMHSDGCSARWNLSNYPGLIRHSAAVICGTLFRDSAKSIDDATFLVIKDLHRQM